MFSFTRTSWWSQIFFSVFSNYQRSNMPPSVNIVRHPQRTYIQRQEVLYKIIIDYYLIYPIASFPIHLHRSYWRQSSNQHFSFKSCSWKDGHVLLGKIKLCCWTVLLDVYRKISFQEQIQFSFPSAIVSIPCTEPVKENLVLSSKDCSCTYIAGLYYTHHQPIQQEIEPPKHFSSPSWSRSD